MDIFEALTNDHRLISRVLDAFERFIDGSQVELDLVELNRFVVFFREYVELTHNEREERLLLPAMESIGFSRKSAPLVHVREEHERERNLLLELRKTAVALRAPEAVERARLIHVARELVAFERAHMRKESELLYPAVKRELTGQTIADLSRKLEGDEERWSRLVEQSWLRSLADDLVRDHASEPPRGAARVG